MTSSRLEHIDVRHLTTNQPFCAGVLLLQQQQLLLTLTSDRLPVSLNQKQFYRVGGMGGRQQSRMESLWDCARRQALEKIGQEVDLISAPQTFFHDIDSGEQYSVTCTDAIKPFLFERLSNLYPYTPYRSHLPGGPYTYFCLFLARSQSQLYQPGVHINGLLCLPRPLWPQLSLQPQLESLLQQGAEVIENQPLTRTHRLWVHPNESFGLTFSLLEKYLDSWPFLH